MNMMGMAQNGESWRSGKSSGPIPPSTAQTGFSSEGNHIMNLELPDGVDFGAHHPAN